MEQIKKKDINTYIEFLVDFYTGMVPVIQKSWDLGFFG